MIDVFFDAIDKAIERGYAVELIVMLLGFAGSFLGMFYIWRYFSNRNANIITTQLEIVANLDQQARTLQETTDTMKLLNDSIKDIMKVDERLTEGQTVIAYGSFMENLFNDFLNTYKDAKRWAKKPHVHLDIDSSSHDLSLLNDKLELGFSTSVKELEDKLRNFKYEDNYLVRYLNREFYSEVDHIRVHLYNSIVEETNDIEGYLYTKCNLFKSDFNSYLREGLV